MSRKRGGVVIGVDKTGDLPALEASARGAAKFGAWLQDEGFEVKTITDADGSVTASQILEAITGFVAAGTYDQLVVYFSGHGYWKNDSELWLLTRAPADANEAVNWKETVDFAKDCGVPNVVLISDACRSIPTTPRAMRVRGSIVFPNDDVRRNRAKVDQFIAASIGTAAYEVSLQGGPKENVFTRCLMQAFAQPDSDMVVEVVEDGQQVRVVPNRRLGPYLRREVATLLAGVNITMDQAPDDEVLSDDSAYIGHARTTGAIIAKSPREVPLAGRGLGGSALRKAGVRALPPDLRGIAAQVFTKALDEGRSLRRDVPATDGTEPAAHPVIPIAAGHPGFDEAVARARGLAPDVRHFETDTGFAVLGGRVVDAALAGGGRLDLLASGDGEAEPAILRVDPDRAACTAVIRLGDGNGVPLAVLRGYVGHVVVDKGRVVNVSYIPSDRNSRFPDYAARASQLEKLRAAAAAAIQFGVFRISDPHSAERLAAEIQVGKGIDPSLGLYAAYAYWEADAMAALHAVASAMRQDLQSELFDVAMLDRDRTGKTAGPELPTAAFCPMLAQGWNLLRGRGISLPGVLDDAQDELAGGLWTTFLPRRADLILAAIRQGELR
ncbi:caspase family protein [Bradyrhizobium sp. WD16]|uniref:caspase family protein n=1 Tax=Bradyrhizobium sp. WD16 TaxID=1521768 RepID=UPI0020A29B22|nr:caspase family protein [Bradyrhizobium sp. WD16]